MAKKTFRHRISSSLYPSEILTADGTVLTAFLSPDIDPANTELLKRFLMDAEKFRIGDEDLQDMLEVLFYNSREELIFIGRRKFTQAYKIDDGTVKLTLDFND